DLGTSNCRSALFDQDMNMLAVSDVEYPLINISPTHIEQDAMLWWESVKKTIKDVLAKADGGGLRSISISSQGISLVPVDEAGQPLANALSWLDIRAQKEEDALEALYGVDAIYRVTGKRANACYTLSKLVWLMENHRETYEKAYKLLLPMDFILFQLCGKAVTDHTMAGGTMFYDIHKQDWAQGILDDQGIDRGKLPEIDWSGKAIGAVTGEVSAGLGIPEGVLVVTGGQDQKCAALGAGISDGSATVSLGTASCITQLSDHPILDEGMRIPCFSYLWPEAWSFEGIINTAASSYQWFRNTFASQHTYKELDALAAAAAEKGERAFFFPYLAGMTSPFWGGATGGFSGISLASGIGQLALAVMDGISCNVKANLDVMQQINKPVREVRLFGGGAKSPVWCQLTADILDLPVVTQSSPETALLGAAMLAKRGYDDKAPAIPGAARVYEPDAKNVSVYKQYYAEYMGLVSKQQ
ncbi:MAG: FGGY family carbohydrate kinase, partial [Clostridiales bacterium]|nr:FGGY family carbohydrate kinase [Clostridiales bacterium]